MPDKHSELKPFLNGPFKNRQSLQPFLDMLDKDTRPGVNDFSVPFHRDAFDWCDAQYVIISHKGEDNIVRWSWNEYSGYKLEMLSDEWFDRVHAEQFLPGTCDREAHNHWEYDSNSGRFCARTRPSLVKVERAGRYGFILLTFNRERSAVPVTGGCGFEEVTGEWRRDGKSGLRMIRARKNGKEVILTEDGLVMEPERDLKKELDEAKERFRTKNDILSGWIDRGRPCAYRHGLSYRGAQAGPITAERARELLKKCTLGGPYPEIGFELLGEPTLVFNEFSENDYY